MSVSGHEKLEASLHVQPFSDSVAGIPIKKRHFLLHRSASPPSQIPSPPQVDHDLPEKKPFSSDRDEPSSETGIHSDQATSMTGKGSSRLSTGESMRRDCNLALRCEILPELNNQGNSAGKETGEAKEIILDSKCLLRDIGCTHFLLAGKNSPEPPTNGFVTGNIAPNEGTHVRQELGQQDLESKSGDAYKEDSELCLNRSNWDLNTTMDEWEGSLNVSTMNLGIGGHDKLDLSGIHNSRTEKGVIQNLYRESTGTDATLSKCTLQNSGGHLRVPNLPTPADKNNNLETCLDLQLKSSFMCSGKFDSLKDLSFLSLSVKPIQTFSGQKLADGITVKPGPNNLISQNDKRKVEMDSLISGLKRVKSEPSERQEPSKTMGLTFMKPAINRVVKSEPLDDLSQVHVRSLEGRIAPTEIKYHSLTLQTVDMKQNGDTQDKKALDLASASQVPDVSLQNTVAEVSKSNVISASTESAGETLRLATEGGDMPISTPFPKDGMEIVNQVSGLTSYSQISQGNETNLVMEASEIDSLHLALVPGSLVSDGKKINADGMAKVVAQMDCSDSYNSSEVTSIYEVPTKLHGNTDTELAGNNVDKVQDTFTKNLEKMSDTGCGIDNSVPSGAVGTLRKLCGSEDDYEDGEVRDPNLIVAVEGLSKENEKKKQIKRSASMSLLDALIAKRSHVDVKEQKIDKSEELNDQGTMQSGPSEMNTPSSSAVAAVTADFGKRRPSRTVRKTTRDHVKKDSGVKEETKSGSDLTKDSISKGKEDDVGRQKVTAGGSTSISSKKKSSEIDNGAKGSDDRSSSRRIVYLNAPNRLTLGKMKSNLSRSISSHIERDSSADKSFRRDRSHSRNSRDENSNERPRRTESERSQGQHFGKRGADFMRGRRSDDRFNGLDGERTSDAGRLLDQVNDSNAAHRFPRSVNASELDSGRLVRKPTNDELQDLSHMPCRRRSPMGRGQMPMIRRPIRDISPSRGVGRGIPDFILHGHEEPDSMMDPSMLVHARSRYGRECQDILTRRERRSFSPVQQRGPMELHHIGSRSFPRSQQRSPHQWSPPRRSPDAFGGQPRELVRCRSPPIIRLNGVRSPQQRQCFPEDMIVRRRDSPPFIARLPNDGVDISPPREHDFPRPLRGNDRNMRRFNLINPREMPEEGYFGPPMHLGQIREFSADDEFVGTRRSNERRGPVRPVRQHILAGNSGGDGFRLQVENAPLQPLRFRPEANEGFPEGGGPRDFDGRFRNRLGGRLRGIEEQGDDYIQHGEQGWDSAGFSDARLKRRRF